METTDKKRTYLYIIFTILSSIVFGIVYHFNRSPIMLIIMMFSPAICSILVRIITKEGFEKLYVKFNFKGNLKWYFFAWFLTPMIAYFGAILYFLLFKNDFDPLNSKLAIAEGITSVSAYAKTLLYMIPFAIIINPITNLLQCFGEELGWRGYLLPKLTKEFSKLKAANITGFVWGIWHVPIILSGYNYGQDAPILGSLAMIVFCIIVGIFSAYLFYKVESIWVPVIFHAAINGIDLWQPAQLFMSKTSNPFIGPNLTGIIGGCGFIIGAIIIIYKIKAEQRR